MENIDKRIAQGYADSADDGGVLAETNKVTPFNFDGVLQPSQMGEINRKLRICSGGKIVRIVRKDPTKKLTKALIYPSMS